MEYNGTKFDSTTAERQAQLEEEKIREIEVELGKGYEDIPVNWNSRDHLSCYLYGGKIQHEERIVSGVYKTGSKVGQPRYKILHYEFELPRLVTPPKGSELLKEGYYGTDEPTLRSIRTSKENTKRIEKLLERSQSNKLVGTYYRGIPELIVEMEWPTDTVHGTFNQCVAATGRLSSTRPNLQNFAGSIKAILTTRYL
jgi:DNA polymerase I-like protein with 3'-5' exonuclease and polymerase domains